MFIRELKMHYYKVFRLIFFFFIGCCLIISCNNQFEKGKTEKSKSHKIKTSSYTAPKNKIIGPTVFLIEKSKLKKRKAGKPKSKPTNTNVCIVGKPLIEPVDYSKLKITFCSAKIDEVKRKNAGKTTYPIKQTKPVRALPFRMRDASTCNIQYLDVEQGINSSYIWSILEDKTGNIWFGTYGGGVCKYNGSYFTRYTEKQGLSNNTVLAILEDKSGNIWFGTDGGGVSKYDGNYFTTYTEKEGLINNHVRSILEDNKGNIWFGTESNGVCMFDGKTFAYYTEKQGLPDSPVTSMIEDKSGNIWFGTDGGGVCKYDNKSFVQIHSGDGLISDHIRSMLEDKHGNIWFGTYGVGVSKFDGKVFSHYRLSEGLSNASVRCMAEDKWGNLWFGTNGGGVNKFDGKTFTHYTEKEGLTSNSIRVIMSDKSGNLWFGTDGGGVCKYNTKSFLHYTIDQGLSNHTVLSLMEDNAGNIWFGTNGGGVNIYNGKSFICYTQNEGLSNNTVWSMLQDKTGSVWLGTNMGGVCMFDGKTFTQYSDKNGLSDNSVLSMLEDSFGNIWFGTDGDGVYKYDGKSFINYTEKQGLAGNTIWTILEDKSGNIWFGTDGGGLSKFNGRFFKNYGIKEGLSNNRVLSLTEDTKGNIWIGTDGGGLCKFDGVFFACYTDKEGLSNNNIYSIKEDREGNLWLGTEYGLNHFIVDEGLTIRGKYNVQKGQNILQIDVLTKEDGLKATDFFENSALLDSKNRIWWGTSKALSMLDLKEYEFNQRVPQVQLENIFIEGNFVDFRNIKEAEHDSLRDKEHHPINKVKFQNVHKFLNLPEKLELPYYLNHLTFNFNAIDWQGPQKMRYRYKLEGFDPNWSKLVYDNTADYRNIPFGEYVFKVEAIGGSHKRSKTFEYPFVIYPPLWRTWWAYAIYAGFAIAIIILIVQWNSRRLIARAHELKIKVDEAIIEIKEQKQLIEEKHKEITDSINYAERIQKSFLASNELLDANLKEYFIFFNPKDVVSGDFYWAASVKNMKNGEAKDLFFLATADSTGHGVPGAIMSLLNITSLEKAIETEVEPAMILNKTRNIIIDRLKKDGSAEGGKDGMDCSLICFDFGRNLLTYTAANNPVWIIRNNEILECYIDRMPVGKHEKDRVSFTQHEVLLEKGDLVLTITDGMPDQFGGPKGKKYMNKQMKELLVSNSRESMEIQKQKISEALNNWKGTLEQVDDITVIGVRV